MLIEVQVDANRLEVLVASDPDLPIAQGIPASMRLDQHPRALPPSSYFPGAGI
jgi:hypothetical protein